MKHKYNYFYKITNKINGHYYYGVHSTDNLEDGYMGSGTRLKKAIEKYGIENFEKEIIKYCDNREEAYKLESDYVTESLIRDDNCYNIILGGEQFSTEFLVAVKDSSGKKFLVHEKDPRFLSGELSGVTRGNFVAIDNNGNTFMADVCDNRLKNGEIHGKNINKVTVKNKKGEYFCVDIDDPRYKSGELTHIWKNRKHSEETINKIKEKLSSIEHQKGEKNSQFGTCWVFKDGINRKIKKETLEDAIKDGWTKGRKTNKKTRSLTANP